MSRVIVPSEIQECHRYPGRKFYGHFPVFSDPCLTIRENGEMVHLFPAPGYCSWPWPFLPAGVGAGAGGKRNAGPSRVHRHAPALDLDRGKFLLQPTNRELSGGAYEFRHLDGYLRQLLDVWR